MNRLDYHHRFFLTARLYSILFRQSPTIIDVTWLHQRKWSAWIWQGRTPNYPQSAGSEQSARYCLKEPLLVIPRNYGDQKKLVEKREGEERKWEKEAGGRKRGSVSNECLNESEGLIPFLNTLKCTEDNGVGCESSKPFRLSELFCLFKCLRNHGFHCSVHPRSNR